MSGCFVLVYLFISWNLSIWDTLFNLLLYIYLYIIFMIFYEIWYICNDIFATKREKSPTSYVEDVVDLKFWKINIIYRIILWCLFLYPIYCFNSNLFFCFFILLFVMWISYTVHNLIRNYNINIFTWTMLRICKIMIFIVFIENLWISDFLVDKIVEAYFIFNSLDFFRAFMLTYNDRFWWSWWVEIYSYSYVIELFFAFIFWILLNNNLFFIVTLSIYPIVIKNIIVMLKKHWIKSNR